MLNIYFSNADGELLEIPYVPYDFLISATINNGTFETSSGKILTLKGEEGQKKFTLDSFFPSKYYSFLSSAVALSTECLDFFNNNLKENLRVIVASGDETFVNMLCNIDTFNYSKKQNNDIDYSLSVSEYVDPLEVV